MPTIGGIADLVNEEIPDGCQSLRDSYANLQKVAEYCQACYFGSENKREAVLETKNYTTQSLASVAYELNTLAYNILQLLDLQTMELAEMESQINHIYETVMIHKEKIARREIGILTTNKNTTRQHKILAPANQERPIKYIRKPVDYTLLDDIGHGVKTTNNTLRMKRTLAPVHQNPLNGSSTGPPPTTKPPSPPQSIRVGGSLTRSAKEYRTPQLPIAPPQVPCNYAPNYPMGHPRRSSGYSTLPMVSAPQPSQLLPQIGMVHPMTHSHHANTLGPSSSIPPPLPPDNEKLTVSPPLPPPPPVDESLYHENYNPLSPPPFQRNRGEPDWVPKNYVEKVVAIYDYCADKEDELSFSENSIIYIIKKNDDGWYEGVMNGVAGLFPGNYVEPCL